MNHSSLFALAFFLASTGAAQAGSTLDSIGNHAAALLFVLGMGALLSSIRNLRSLRYKRIAPQRRERTVEAETLSGAE